jgi:short-subunit dehydrogenase|tara:strand:- start:1077 stop:1814 length:738 start_codon:yes stop_codon:yes gene_type:complete
MKNILIIGATSAIAKECAKIWAERGDKLFLVARNEENVKNIAENLINKDNIFTKTFCLDFNHHNEHVRMLDAAEKELVNIDLVLIAHGTLLDQKECEVNVELAITEIKNNALSTISLLTHLANRFEHKKKGTIAIISSVAGERGRATNYVYGSSKAMVTTFASGLRQRLDKFNVKVITIKLGLVDTPMTSRFKKGLLWSKPQYVAKKIVQSIDNNKDEVYLPKLWYFVFFLIKSIPSSIFKKLHF